MEDCNPDTYQSESISSLIYKYSMKIKFYMLLKLTGCHIPCTECWQLNFLCKVIWNGSGVCDASSVFLRDAVTDTKIQCHFPQCLDSHTVNASKSGSEKDNDDKGHSVTCWRQA
jgi:hypothetical protein